MVEIEQYMPTTEMVLTLLQTKGLGRKTAKIILDILTTDKEGLGSSYDGLHLYSILQKNKDKLKKAIKTFNLSNKSDLDIGNDVAHKILNESDARELKVITYYDAIFPPQLHDISDPPLVIFVKGNEKCLSNSAVAVVGTRKPSKCGEDTSKYIGNRLACSGIVVVSGLAEGIDAAAHRGCVEANGQTIAVLSHGLGMIYPATNRNLAEDIVDKGGCLLSEYPPFKKPTRYSFVDRDRIQSGLCKAVLVVETAEKGGTMHTVKFCVNQGRILFATLPHSNATNASYMAGYQKLVNEYNAKSINWESEKEIHAFIKEIIAEEFTTGEEISLQTKLSDFHRYSSTRLIRSYNPPSAPPRVSERPSSV